MTNELIRLTKRTTTGIPSTTLTLPFEQRTRARLRVTLDDGRSAGLFLERGQILRDGDLLSSEQGEVIRIQAADETVSTVACADPLQLARAAYHLGNRHVPLQIAAGWLRYGHDHVLDDMLRGLGLTVRSEQAPFEPEPGAYGGGHHHDHGHGHDSSHTHSHGDAHGDLSHAYRHGHEQHQARGRDDDHRHAHQEAHESAHQHPGQTHGD